jgi:hypothetical protein
MTSKKFEISSRTAGPSGLSTPERDQVMDRFIEGTEAMTTMTVQIPERLKHALKQAALDRKTTVKALLIEIIEGHLTAVKP